MSELDHNAHLTEWAERFRSKEQEPFVPDGALADYWQADTGICAVLKEPRERPKYGDLRDHHIAKLENDLTRGDSIFRVSVWAAAIKNRCGTYDKCRQEGLVRDGARELAVVNLKKTPGGSRTVSAELHEFASLHRDDLIQQIKSLDPEIALGYGKWVGSILMWLFRLEWESLPVDALKPLRWARRHRRTFISLTHPSAPGAAKQEYGRLSEAWPRIQKLA